jgi:hypothetical protein
MNIFVMEYNPLLWKVKKQIVWYPSNIITFYSETATCFGRWRLSTDHQHNILKLGKMQYIYEGKAAPLQAWKGPEGG